MRICSLPRDGSGWTFFLQLLNQILTFLGVIGVLVDPTTAGIGDSERAMRYEEPWDDNRE